MDVVDTSRKRKKTIVECNGLNVYASPEFIFEILTPKVILEYWDLGK